MFYRCYQVVYNTFSPGQDSSERQVTGAPGETVFKKLETLAVLRECLEIHSEAEVRAGRLQPGDAQNGIFRHSLRVRSCNYANTKVFFSLSLRRVIPVIHERPPFFIKGLAFPVQFGLPDL